jgi:hypothetical protein
MRWCLLNTIQRNKLRFFDLGKRFGRILSKTGMGHEEGLAQEIWNLKQGGTVQTKVSIQVTFFAVCQFHQGL